MKTFLKCELFSLDFVALNTPEREDAGATIKLEMLTQTHKNKSHVFDFVF